MPTDIPYIPAILRTQRLVPLLVLMSLVMTGNGMVAPMLSLYAQQFGVSGTLIGMMITLFGVGRLFANMPAGILSERFGRRPFMCIGPAIIAIGAIGAAVSTGFEALLISRFVQGVGSGIYMTVSATVLVQVSRVGERGRIMAIYQASLLFGAGIGPAIGGLLAAHLGYSAPFWAYAGVGVAAFLVAYITFQEPDAAETGEEEPNAPPPSMRKLLSQLPFLLLCLITFGVFFTRTASQWLLIPLIGQETFGLSVDVIGFALSVTAVANFLMFPIVGPAIDWLGARIITISSTLLTGVALGMVALTGSEAMFWAAMVLLGIAGGFNGPSVAAAMADQVPRGLFGPAIGLQRAVGDAGFVLAPILVGLLYDFTSVGHAGGMLANAALMIGAGVIFAVASRSRPPV